MDRDGDGVVNASEFVEVARRTIYRAHRVGQQARQQWMRDDVLLTASPCTSSLLLAYYGRRDARAKTTLAGVGTAVAPVVGARHAPTKTAALFDRQTGSRMGAAGGGLGIREDSRQMENREEEKAAAAAAAAAAELLEVVDPYCLGGIPFSDCVGYLARDIAAGFMSKKPCDGQE